MTLLARDPTRRRSLGRGVATAIPVVLVLGAGACGTDPGPPDVQVASALVTEGDQVTAAYVTLTNEGGGDRLVGASSPVADRVVLHETVEQDGLLLMRLAEDGFAVPAGGDLALVPGGAHIMLEELVAPLHAGEHVTLTLDLAESGPVTADAEVVSQIELNERLLPEGSEEPS